MDIRVGRNSEYHGPATVGIEIIYRQKKPGFNSQTRKASNSRKGCETSG